MVLKNSHTSKDTKKFCFLCVVNRSEIEGLAAEAVRAFKERRANRDMHYNATGFKKEEDFS